ncbi:TetR family transcriptional regulator [Streptomyces sp. IMTB 2501]|uniref:TetR/AcrR family transcriptional regulator n=1 Tax=Streptomyces sp. IMTB 2501 TaxID=1776340 RepID=UPI00096E5C91|nr:TetR family transcriptional regulator [Streptomyces sp. IMTB 2501]OLZ67893.1 TetR family transcriptional regulator [Streptomyces sp. IMTB 2501]
MTERRKAETRTEIARAAAALFVRQGLRATRAEDIAQAAGIAPRTFYRYFATKEEAVAPLYAAGARCWAEAVRAAPAHLTVPEALEHAVHHTLTPGAGVSAASWEWVRTLIRLADASPALRKVWAEVCQESDRTLAEILMSRSTGPKSSEVGTSGAGGAEAAKDREESGGRGGHDGRVGREANDNVAPCPTPSTPPGPITPDLRFAAAVAGAAVRVAVESWAATSSPPTGPEGPAALALHNLGSLRGFGWGGQTQDDT